jgi:uncharacterized protein (TIGR02001 family)
MKVKLSTPALILLSGLSTCTYATEQTDFLNGNFSGQFTLASDYVFRGESETVDSNIPAVQLSTTWTHQSNWYVGVLASTNKFESAPDVDSVVGPYIGQFGKIGSTDINYNVFLFHYIYPGVGKYNFTELWIKADKQLDDFNLGIELTPTLNQWFGVTGFKGINYALHSSYNITAKLKLNGSYGYQQMNGSDARGWKHHNIGLSYSHNAFTFDFRYHDTDITTDHPTFGGSMGVKIFKSRVVIGFNYDF